MAVATDISPIAIERLIATGAIHSSVPLAVRRCDGVTAEWRVS
jgi:hypothetical protein